MSQTFCSFVVPTVGRASLTRAVDSIRSQFDPDWRAVIVVDSEEQPSVPTDFTESDRIDTIYPDIAPGSAGIARNMALDYITDDHDPFIPRSRWVGFLDDDDELHPDYVRWLRGHDDGIKDCVVFRMIYPTGRVLPDFSDVDKLRWAKVGISFAVKSDFLQDTGLRFIREHDLQIGGPERNEDIKFLNDVRAHGGRVVISPKIAYYVNGRTVNL